MIPDYLKSRLDVALEVLEIEMRNNGVPPTTIPGGLIHPVVFRSNVMAVIQGIWQLVIMESNLEGLKDSFSAYNRLEAIDTTQFDELDVRITEIQLDPSQPPFPTPVWITPLGGIMVGIPMTDVDYMYEAIARANETITKGIMDASPNIIKLR